MGSLAALIAALERAEEGSRELSDEVLLALGWGTRLEFTREVWVAPSGNSSKHRPHPTRNLQAAVDLVPEGWGWAAAELDQGEPSAVLTNREPQLKPGTFDANPDKKDFRSKAATPALALVIAILKAVETKDG